MIALFWTIATWTGVVWWACVGLFLFAIFLGWIGHKYGPAAVAWIVLILLAGIAGNFE